MSKLVTRNGKMYKEVPCYGPEGIIECFRLVEVPTCPVVPPTSLFTECSPIVVPEALPETVVQAEIEEEDVESTECVEEVVESECLILEHLEVQKTIEDTDVMGDMSDNDAASSTGSSSIDQTETEELDSEDVKEAVLQKRSNSHLAFSKLDAFDFDNELRTIDGYYLTNVDGKYVFEKKDISSFLSDGKVHRLHFRDTANKLNRAKKQEICLKPLYKALKNIQVRNGPGSRFAKAGVVKANEQVIVIQEGILKCDLTLVREWMKLHLPAQMVYDFGRSKAPTLEDFINEKWIVYNDDTLTFFSEKIYHFDEAQIETFRKAVAATSRKVKVLFLENGVEKTGWISKRKNSGALITRIYGKSTPQVVISGVRTEMRDVDFANPEACEGTFVPDAMKYFDEHTKKTTIKYFDSKGEPKERTETHHCKPTMAFYKNLAKSEISAIIGSKKSRFTVDWQSSFRSDRFRGLEKQSVLVDGKKRYRTGYNTPSKELTVTFQRLSEAITFFNADLDQTRFSTGYVDWEASYENLVPVNAAFCPEYRVYKSGFARRSEVGISFIQKV